MKGGNLNYACMANVTLGVMMKQELGLFRILAKRLGIDLGNRIFI